MKFISEYYLEYREIPIGKIEHSVLIEWVDRYNRYSLPLGRHIDITGGKHKNGTSDLLIPKQKRLELENLRRQAVKEKSAKLHEEVDELYKIESFKIISDRKNYW